MRKLKEKFQGIELHHVPQRTTTPLTSSQNWWPNGNPPADGVFVNDLHEPSTSIREDLTQTHSNTNLALGGSDPLTCSDPNERSGALSLAPPWQRHSATSL